MPRSLQLLLTENVENTGIVGDVVTVRKGYARNYLLPRGYATTPSEEKIKSLAAKRAEAERQLAELRKQREELIKKLEGYELAIIRSCNDQGQLYAAVTQHDIAAALEGAGFPGIKDREVRLGQTIKRIDTYEIHVKFEADLEATIKLWVNADRKLDLRRGDEPTPEGTPGEENLTPAEKRHKDRTARSDKGEGKGEGKSEHAEDEVKAEKAEKPAKAEKAEKAEKPAKAEKAAKGEKAKK